MKNLIVQYIFMIRKLKDLNDVIYMKVNLCCGTIVLEDYVNYDFNPINEKVKYIDLNDLNNLSKYFKNNTIDEFKSTFNGMDDFDDIIDMFTFNYIDKDMVLDKMSALGSDSLTENDYVILKS